MIVLSIAFISEDISGSVNPFIPDDVDIRIKGRYLFSLTRINNFQPVSLDFHAN